ncbi:hypothetical protein [Solibacillus sp.]|uniref:hypothetical protein n=1 Tax=Solibacillus sp. TaxID=1909654 RepID=UPI003315422D
MEVKQLEGAQAEKIQFLEDEFALLFGKYEVKEQQLETLRNSKIELEIKIEKLTNQLADVKETLVIEKVKLKDSNAEHTKQKRELEKQRAVAEQKLLKEQQGFKQKLQALDEEREELLAVQEEIEQERVQFQKLKQDFSLADAITTQAELTRVKASYESIVALTRRLQEEKSQLQNRIDHTAQLESENTLLKTELERRDEMVRIYRQSEVEWARIEQLKEDYEAMSTRMYAVEGQNKTLQSELARTREQAELYREQAERVTTAEHKSAFYEIRLRSLEAELQRLQKKEKDAIADESRMFESFQVLIEKSAKTASNLTKYPGDGQAVERILHAATQGNYEFSSAMIHGFLAAMRSTRFIILKGLSGTGKTSLPKIVAHALGGICETIAVQPNWKSKTDLIGFYNHFNDRFMATQFTEELFKAQLPENRDKFYFIVLDEMNLARVEYYFSDFNSKLELEQSKQVVELFDTIGRTSGDLADYIIDGNKLRIPPNVFFIGTINEDESTYTLSDKIYDRAQVLDFQAALSNKVGDMERIEAMPSVSFSDFKAAMATIQKVDVTQQSRPLQEVLQILSEQLYLEIGNRPRRHMRTFMQTYAANNWNVKEAIDLQIVSKIVPKIMPSYDEEFELAMDAIIRLAEAQKVGATSSTIRAIEKVKRNAK